MDAVTGMKVNRERMAHCANEYWSQASTIVGFLVKEHGMSYRTGHQVLATMMQAVADRNIPPSEVTPDVLEGAIEKYTGRKIEIGAARLAELFDAMYCVRQRKYRAGAAPERVQEHIAAALVNVERDSRFVMERLQRTEMARNRLDSAFSALLARTG